MRAAVLQQPGELLAIVDRPDPRPGPGEVLLRVEACGICGSDLHLSDAYPMPGLVLGHEFCGTVADVGTGVDTRRVGDRVTALSLAPCGECAACMTGRVRKCPRVAMIGIERPGAYAEYVVVNARDTFVLPTTLDHRHGALIEPLAVALHTVRRAGAQPGDDALVLGGGPVGLAVASWLRALGAREVAVSDPVASRRVLAERLGATVTIDPTVDDVGDAFAAVTGTRPRLVIECVGVPGLLQHAADVAAVDATVVVAGVCMAPDTITPLVPMTKELDVRFAFYYEARDYQTTIELIDRGRIDPLPLVTSEVPLEQTPQAFADLKHPSDQCKVLITP
ncbi:alcohol dehydrogenase catalytic domain-containing protein [Rhabdothermincola sediminis]|uniref:alcohol dehydrogenase catalytic domain-containing protein n=1 Tax=Rhabdothermincola sediminis TaxID=2751370 RepID=UPI001AA04911|nr:alcohol dehydrogenase catalytic domain-containing protein [Rhabdothermincola sediminis]